MRNNNSVYTLTNTDSDKAAYKIKKKKKKSQSMLVKYYHSPPIMFAPISQRD